MAEGKRSSLAGILILYTGPGRIQPLGRANRAGHLGNPRHFCSVTEKVRADGQDVRGFHALDLVPKDDVGPRRRRPAQISGHTSLLARLSPRTAFWQGV